MERDKEKVIEEEEYENLKSELKLDTDQVEIDVDDDLIFVTVGVYKMFIKIDYGMDALLLYLHLMFTAKMQSVYDVNLRKGLGWSRNKIVRIKDILKEMGLIECTGKVDPETGKFVKELKII